ncbi:MAG: 3-deoxy-7-phosphoheptulonate synthase class II, partial [Chloroflexi bacterium]
MKNTWAPDSWKKKPVCQQPEYKDPKALRDVMKQIAALPPIVFPGQVDELKKKIALAAEGRAFILQGGDCVERFSDCDQATITNKLKILLQMSIILAYAARRPVVRIGRIAGQYAKPRSSETEAVGGRTIFSYRGDSINGAEPTAEAREPDPARLTQSYFYSAATLNYIRAMIDSGFADLHHPYSWNLHAMEQSP